MALAVLNTVGPAGLGYLLDATGPATKKRDIVIRFSLELDQFNRYLTIKN